MKAGEVVWEFFTRLPIDSLYNELGWNTTNHAGQEGNFSYVGFNTGKGKNRKTVYKVSSVRGGQELEFSLIISQENNLKEAFKECNKRCGVGIWGENKRDCFIRYRKVLGGLSVGSALELIKSELDRMYSNYNKVLNPQGVQNTGNKKVETIDHEGEELPGQSLCPEYDFKHDGWDGYIKWWDGFIESWYDSDAMPKDEFTKRLMPIFNAQNANVRLDTRELPEPYYGDPTCAKGVVVNLNPGASFENENTKFFGGNGALINEFSNCCKKQYSIYAKRWSPLDDRNVNICGFDWWHNSNRVDWFKRFFDAEVSDLFILEACPYHSRSWSGGMDLIVEHLVYKVVCPAIAAAAKIMTGTKCAVFVGSAFNWLVAKVKGVKPVLRKRGSRTYSLYSCQFENENVYMLVINGVQGMFLPKDSKGNLQIEDEIKKIIKGV